MGVECKYWNIILYIRTVQYLIRKVFSVPVYVAEAYPVSSIIVEINVQLIFPVVQIDAHVFLFIDAFGWKFFEKYKNRYPFLQRFIDNGVVSKITAQFPSTTAAEVTTITILIKIPNTDKP